jgi:Domain of unknown function (DUF4476)
MKIGQLIILFLFAALLHAPAGARSKISVSMSLPGTLKVVIDGRKFYSEENNITIADIAPGMHRIKIFFSTADTEDDDFFSKNAFLPWKYIASSDVPVRDNVHYELLLSRFGKLFVDKDQIGMRYKADNTQDEIGFGTGYSEDYEDRAFFKANTKRILDITAERMQQDQYLQNRNGDGHGQDQFGTRTVRGDVLINPEAYGTLKEMVEKEITEGGKLLLIKDATSRKMVTAKQSKELCSMFSSEFTKEDFAKYIYAKVMDKSNFFIIYDTFQSPFTKEEVSNYISKQAKE